MALALLMMPVGCGDVARPPAGDDRTALPEGTLVADAESLLQAELQQTDREFARRVRETRLEGWVEAFAEEGMVLPAIGPVARGPNEIRELYAPLFADPDFEITWSPVGAEVASSGDFGYTFGDWQTSLPAGGAGGQAKNEGGKYVTIWRREEDGRWRVILDIGNSPGGE